VWSAERAPRRVLLRFVSACRAWLGAPRRRLLRRRAALAALLLSGGFLSAALWRSGLESPPPTFLLRDRHGLFLGEVGEQGPRGEFGYWPVGELPPRVVAAALAVEDHRFWSHPGVDPLALLRAAAQNLRARDRVSGASTVAMQVARMQRPGSRSYARKALEALTALCMTLRHGRGAVLAHYLRIVPYGNRIHGIAYAARRYLDKPVADLSWAETAFLAAIPQAPARMNPFDPEGRVRAVERGERILDLLAANGSLSREDHELARRQIVDLRVPPPGERPRAALHAILRLEAELQDPKLRARLARRPILDTSLDLGLQEEASFRVRRAVRAWEAQGAGNAALLVVDRATNEVLADVGSTDFFDARHAGAIDYSRVPRSPGSALKPFLYALALERRTITPATVLDDLARGPGGITNADDAYLGPLLPRVALANSRNVPAAELLDRVGLDEGYAFLRDLGLHKGEIPARRLGLGLAIGGLNVTLERLVRAYSVFSSDGRLRPLLFVRGREQTDGRRLLSEDTTREIALFLSDPEARLPTFERMGPLEYPFAVAVKTGTSSRFRDAWAVAFSSRYLVGAWVGDPDFRPMHRLSGSLSAAELVQQVLLGLQPEETGGLDDVAFPTPRGSQAVRLCALTGRRATPACERVVTEYLAPGDVPPDSCRAHVRLLVDSRSGRPATPRTPLGFREVRAFVDLPPRYAAWAARARLPLLPLPDGPYPLPETRHARVSITSPANGLTLLRDPETPPDRSTVGLAAVVEPPAAQVVWYVDGRPWRIAAYPYAARWPLRAGEHVFQARVPQAAAASALVRVIVQ
jgi:penicillin-binding protein 1C